MGESGEGKKSLQVWLYGHILPQVMLISCDCILCYKTRVFPAVLSYFIVIIIDKTKQNIGEGMCGLIKISYLPSLK